MSASPETVNSSFSEVETRARLICAAHGRDYDAKWCKQKHWRAMALRELARESRSLLGRLARACGWAA